MGGLLSPPDMPEVKMPPRPPPPARVGQPGGAEAEMAGAKPDDEAPKTTGSKRKTRVYNKKQRGTSKYKGGGLNVV